MLTEIEPAPFQFHAGGPCSDLEVMICREVAGICTIVSKKRELQKQGMSAFILDATKKMYALFSAVLTPISFLHLF